MRRPLRWFALGLCLCRCGVPSDEIVRSVGEELQQCATSTVDGIDVYDGTGTINWRAVQDAGIAWASIKATQGTYNTQTRFAANRAGAHDAGIYVAPYHFFDPTEDGMLQAQHFLSTVGALGALDLPAVLDAECPDGDPNCLGSSSGSGVTAGMIRERILSFLQTVESATGRTPIVYTFNSYFSGNAVDTTGLDHYPLWIAAPTVTTHCGTGGTMCFSIPSPWTKAAMWQWSWVGCVSGISGNVDRDRFIGTLADLVSFAAATSDGGIAMTDGGAPLYAARYVAQSWPPASMGAIHLTPGQSASVWIEMRNTGTASWDMSTRLATTVPRNRSSALSGPDWVQPDRPAEVTGTVPPGGSFRFGFTLVAPMAPGTYDEHFGLTQENVAWFGDPGQGGPADGVIEAIIEVAPVDGGTMDAGMPDAGLADAGASPPDGGTGRPGTTGGCGCDLTTGTGGWWALALVALLVVRRRCRGGAHPPG
jgi:GH25 family lysozyme M1 (1,4-beta-N-acetylmuramidase)